MSGIVWKQLIYYSFVIFLPYFFYYIMFVASLLLKNVEPHYLDTRLSNKPLIKL